MKQLLIVPIIAALFVSCATKVKGLQKSESFTFENVKNGKMIAGGVVHSIDDWKYKSKISYANKLKTEIMEEREMLKVTDAGFLAKKIGKKAYAQALKELEEDGMLSENSIINMRKKVKGRRYVVFARVESDDTSQDRRHYDETDSQGNSTGRSLVDATTNRKMDVVFSVLDLTEGNTVWNGTITKSNQNKQTYTVKKDSGLVSIIKAVKGTEERSSEEMYPFPKAPRADRILSMAFKGFAENLPEED